MVFILLVSLFAGCGGGGSGTTPTGAGDNPVAAGNNQALLGPLSGTEIRAYRLTDLNSPVEGPLLAKSSLDDLTLAGSFDLVLANIPEDEWVLVTATGGMDIDADDDGNLNANATLNKGTIQAIATAGDWRNGVKVTAVTDMIFRRLALGLNLADATKEEVAQRLATLAVEAMGDVNEDGQVDYQDVLRFDPKFHASHSVVPWQRMLQGYIPAVHQDADPLQLQRRIDLLLASLIPGQTNDGTGGRSALNGVSASGFYNIETLDADLDGAVDRAVIRQEEERTYIQAVISGNSAASETVVVDINHEGKDLRFSFVTVANLLGGVHDPLLAALADGVLFKALPSATYPGLMEIEIPKALMSLVSTTAISTSVNGQPGNSQLFIVQDDPIIGWYFGDGNDSYDLPPAGSDGWIIQQPIVFNEGELVFNWREGSCNVDEAFLGSTDNLYDARFFPAAEGEIHPYNFCVAHILYDLTSDTGAANSGPFTTLFSYDPQNGQVYSPETAPSGAMPVKIAAMNPDVVISATMSRSDPFGDGACGFSIGSNNLLGDCAFHEDGRVWMSAILPGIVAPVLELNGTRYYHSAKTDDPDITYFVTNYPWWQWQGFVGFNVFQVPTDICNGRGKRLPSQTELLALFQNGGAHIGWDKEFAPSRYWNNSGGYLHLGTGAGSTNTSLADQYTLCVE
jgi:hypothetical protein